MAELVLPDLFTSIKQIGETAHNQEVLSMQEQDNFVKRLRENASQKIGEKGDTWVFDAVARALHIAYIESDQKNAFFDQASLEDAFFFLYQFLKNKVSTIAPQNLPWDVMRRAMYILIKSEEIFKRIPDKIGEKESLFRLEKLQSLYTFLEKEEGILGTEAVNKIEDAIRSSVDIIAGFHEEDPTIYHDVLRIETEILHTIVGQEGPETISPKFDFSESKRVLANSIQQLLDTPEFTRIVRDRATTESNRNPLHRLEQLKNRLYSELDKSA